MIILLSYKFKHTFSSIILILFLSPRSLARAHPNHPTRFTSPHDLIYTALTITLFTIAFVVIYFLFYCSINQYLLRHRRPTRPNPNRVRPDSPRARGLDQYVLRTFPVFAYSEAVVLKGPVDCAVCLGAFERDEILRLLPTCDHVFHVECVNTWLDAQTTCPYCRAELSREPGGSTRVEVGGVAEEVVVREVNEVRNDVLVEVRWEGAKGGQFGKLRRWNSTGHVASDESFMLTLSAGERSDIVTGMLSRSSRSLNCIIEVKIEDVV